MQSRFNKSVRYQALGIGIVYLLLALNSQIKSMTKLFLSWINLQSFFYSLVASKLESFAVVAKSLHNSGISSKWRHAGLICNIIWLDFPISFMPRNCSDNFWANRVSFHVSVKFCIILDSVLNALSRCVLWCLSLYSDAKIFIQCLMVSLPGQTEWNKNILRTQTFTPQLHFYQYLSISFSLRMKEKKYWID